MDRFRGRSPDRRHGPPPTDSYIPSGRPARPRSRSPPRYRSRDREAPRPSIDSYRGGSRRYESGHDAHPPRDSRPRSPRRDYPTESRYDDPPRPSRDRSPSSLKRGRDISPGRGMPPKRERMASPAREYGRARSPPRSAYRPRSRSPRREDPYAAKTWRRRSPSPRSMRPEGRSGGGSGRESLASSRRSSPRPPARAPENYGPPEDYRASAPFRSPPRVRSPPRREPPRSRSPHAQDPYSTRPRHPSEDRLASGSGYPAAAHDHRDRAPPTGPSNPKFREPPMAPPTGPAAAPISGSSRPGGPPTGPYSRGGYGGYRGRGGPHSTREYPPRDFSGPPPPRRGSSSWGAPGGFGRGGPPRDGHAARESGFDARGIPRRESSGFGPRGNSSSLTTPRTQRFNTALQDVPKIKEGGEKLPSMQDTTKADKLEEEAARLRKMIDEKQMKKRQGLREWERLERETSNSALRTELAEEHLKTLNGEDGLATAAF